MSLIQVHKEDLMSMISRRDLVRVGVAGGLAALGPRSARARAATVIPETSKLPDEAPTGRVVTIEAKPGPIPIDTTKTAVIVVDMENDFGAKGGMFDRAGIDISGIQKAVGPTAKVLASARAAGVKIIYLKMGYRPDLSDLGASDSVNRVRHLEGFKVGERVRAPDGRESRILIRDNW